MLEQALPILEKHFGPRHPKVASGLVGLGAAYGSLGDHAKQLELLQLAAEIKEEFFGG